MASQGMRDDDQFLHASMFKFAPHEIEQFDLKTASSMRRHKTRHIPSMNSSMSAESLADCSRPAKEEVERKVLRSTLRPLLAPASTQNLHAKPEPALISEAGRGPLTEALATYTGEQDAEIVRRGIATSDDAVNYFTSATKDAAIKFVHLVPAETGMAFRPYSLDVAPAAVAVSQGDYYTMSKSGLVHCVLRKGANATEFISMEDWVRNSTLFNLVRSISFFKNFIPFKAFRRWQRNVRQKLYADQRRCLQSRLFLARTMFCQPCIEIKNITYGLRKATLVVVPKARIQSDPLEAFMDQQSASRKDAMTLCEATMKRVAEITAATCDAVQTLGENKSESDDPRKRLEALMAAKLELKANVKTKSMNAVVEEKKAQRRLVQRAAEDRAMLSSFVRLADCMMVEIVVEHVLFSLEEQLLADFLDPQHKIGLFEVALGFDNTGLVFNPTLDDFFAMASRLADDVLGLVGRIPRVLDARGCAEHCTSGAYASKFELLIRSLPRYKNFMTALELKFRNDFEVSRIHNAPVSEVVRPIYDASCAFDLNNFRLKEESYAEARHEFEQLLAWSKDVEKLRTRDSVGTIEVTSRILKQTLSRFVESKLDLLKAIIRDMAQVKCANVLKTLMQRVKVLEGTPTDLKQYADYIRSTMNYDEREMRKQRGVVDQMYTLLQSNEVKIPPDDLVALDEMHSFATQYSDQLTKSKALKENALQSHSEQLDKNIVALSSDLDKFVSEISTGHFVDASHFDVPGQPLVKQELERKAKELDRYTELARTYSSYKELFGYTADDCPPLKRATDQFKLVEKLWKCVGEWHDAHSAWMSDDLTKFDAENVDRSMQVFSADAFVLNKKIHSDVSEKLLATINDFKPLMALIMDLGNPAMLPHHWNRLFDAMKKSHDQSKQLTLSDLLSWGVRDHADLVSEISAAASGESQLEKVLNNMETVLENLCFSTKEWRGISHILVGIDEIQQELDDQIVKTQAMRGSRFVKPFLERTTEWERVLFTLQEIIDNWMLVQSAWLYLEPIFSSDDIARQIPAESRMFKVVNQVWKDSMASVVSNPAVISAARREGLVDRLKDSNEKLERINKGSVYIAKSNPIMSLIFLCVTRSLSDYLETKRLAFPRFVSISLLFDD